MIKFLNILQPILLAIIGIGTLWPTPPVKVSLPADTVPIEIIARYQAEIARAMESLNHRPAEVAVDPAPETWSKNVDGLWEIVPQGEDPYPSLPPKGTRKK